MDAKKRTRTGQSGTEVGEAQFTVVLEDLRAQFRVFGEALQGLREHMDQRFEAVDRRFEAVDRRFDAIDRRFEAVDRRFDAIEAQLGRLTDAVRTHSNELRKINTKLGDHEDRICGLEGVAQ